MIKYIARFIASTIVNYLLDSEMTGVGGLQALAVLNFEMAGVGGAASPCIIEF